MASNFPTFGSDDLGIEHNQPISYGTRDELNRQFGSSGYMPSSERDQMTTQGSYWRQLFQNLGWATQGATADPRGPIAPSSMLELAGRDLQGASDAGRLDVDAIYVTHTRRTPESVIPTVPNQSLQGRVDALLAQYRSPFAPGAAREPNYRNVIVLGVLVLGGVLVARKFA
jgi:hypothetical protein